MVRHALVLLVGGLAREGAVTLIYRNRPQETAAMFAADGWIRTGDLGRLDNQGRLQIVAASKR
jgi:fatty-acyl-CoA synthase